MMESNPGFELWPVLEFGNADASYRRDLFPLLGNIRACYRFELSAASPGAMRSPLSGSRCG